MVSITTCLQAAIEKQASDLLVCVGLPPALRITGKLVSISGQGAVSAKDAQEMAFALLSEEKKKIFFQQKEVDFSYDFEGKARFRVNIYLQRGNISLALRLVRPVIKSIQDLGLPAVLHDLVGKSQGLVLITGASGQGKSTTLAAILDEINHTRAVHIVTIEDPIEYMHKSDKAIIDQREVGSDTATFATGLKAAFRQDPDVIMLGEMRDLETISTAITAAETGHLVFATLHTNSAAQSIDRIVDVFEGGQQNQIRFQLASSLLAVISQRLLPRISGGFIPVCEVMLSNSAVANLIRENKNHELPSVIETSMKDGMISFNRAMADLVHRKEIPLKDALDYSPNPTSLKNLVG